MAVSTGNLGTNCTRSGESYEGLLVTVSEVEVLSEPDKFGQIRIDDGSGVTELEDSMLNTDEHLMTLIGGTTIVGTVLEKVTGVVRYAYGSFEVHPRFEADVVVDSATDSLPRPPPSPLAPLATRTCSSATLFFSQFQEASSGNNKYFQA